MTCLFCYPSSRSECHFLLFLLFSMHSHLSSFGFPKLFARTKSEVALTLLVRASLTECDGKILCDLYLDVVLLETIRVSESEYLRYTTSMTVMILQTDKTVSH